MYTRDHSHDEPIKLPKHYSGCAFREEERTPPPLPEPLPPPPPPMLQKESPGESDLPLLLGLCFLLFNEGGSRDLLLCLAVLLFCGGDGDFTHLFEKRLAF